MCESSKPPPHIRQRYEPTTPSVRNYSSCWVLESSLGSVVWGFEKLVRPLPADPSDLKDSRENLVESSTPLRPHGSICRTRSRGGVAWICFVILLSWSALSSFDRTTRSGGGSDAAVV